MDTVWCSRLDDTKYEMMQNMLLDRLSHTNFKTDLHFAVTSSRLIKVTLTVMKIQLFPFNI